MLANQAPGQVQQSGRKGMTLQHSASGLGRDIAYRNQSLANITTEPKYPMTTNHKSGSAAPVPGAQNPINKSHNTGFSNTLAPGKRSVQGKLPNTRHVPVDDLPSDISDD